VRTSIKWLIVYPAIIIALLVDAEFAPGVVVSALAFAVSIEAYRQSTGGGREHYMIAAIGLIVFSILPLFDVLPAGKYALTPLIGIMGLIYVVGGVLDHRELVRALTTMQEEWRVASV
jgi:FtsH-binding integral membrane protein